MRFISGENPPYELTFADVFLLPQDYAGGSRQSVDITPTDPLPTTLPLVAADMLAVTGRRTAETLARRGGVAVLSHDLAERDVRECIDSVKAAHPVWQSAPAVCADTRAADVRHLADAHGHGFTVVTDGSAHAVGTVPAGRLRAAQGHERLGDLAVDTPVLDPGTPLRDAFAFLTERGADVALVHRPGHPGTIATPRGTVRSLVFPPALDDSGRLLTAVAVGMTGDAAGRAERCAAHGADVVVLHTPHAAQAPAREAVARLRERIGDRVLVAGVAVTGEATEALIGAGADVVKVGLGGGAMCTTRMMTGVGRPQFTAVQECARAARALGRTVWSDGGVRHPRDVVLALAAGASSVMVGSWFARTLESPPPLLRGAAGEPYKESFGIASKKAVADRSARMEPLERELASYFDEGLSTSRLGIDPEQPGLEDVIDRIAAGLRSGCTYTGATSLAELHERAVIGLQSGAGYAEGAALPRGW
ncbi:GuaB1 family IMP dehydrogenase-related protein [Kitasatospora saccharophila]|uniref:GMP reductase n=1 Tax=Kitasatospora saccharophila TaxID=407973 RepID=A0ABP5JQ82_9ACTN